MHIKTTAHVKMPCLVVAKATGIPRSPAPINIFAMTDTNAILSKNPLADGIVTCLYGSSNLISTSLHLVRAGE